MNNCVTPTPALGFILTILLIQPALAAPDDTNTLYQSVSGNIFVETEAKTLNDSSPLNPMNLAALNETGAVLKGRFEWTLKRKENLFLQLCPAFEWQMHSSSFTELGEQGLSHKDNPPSLNLESLELQYSLDAPAFLPWLYSDLVFGRLYPEVGIATIDPLSVLMDGHKEEPSKNPWLAGLLLYMGPLALEAWCETEEKPQSLIIAQALVDKHEMGALWAYDQAHRAGIWYRTSLTDSLMTSFEYQIQEDDPFSPLKKAERRIFWHNSFLVSFAWTPGLGDTGIWLEYRYRENGLDSENIEDMYSLNSAESLSLFSIFPWLRSPVHSAGLHIRNTVPIEDKWNFQGSVFWLGSKGFHLDTLAEFLPGKHLSMELEASAPFYINTNNRPSETELWPYHFCLSFRARWIFFTQE